jgi:hypothetical protein
MGDKVICTFDTASGSDHPVVLQWVPIEALNEARRERDTLIALNKRLFDMVVGRDRLIDERCLERRAAVTELAVCKTAMLATGAYIADLEREVAIRLTAEEANELLKDRDAMIDDLEKQLTAAQIHVECPSHNPFRDFGGDRRRVGG